MSKNAYERINAYQSVPDITDQLRAELSRTKAELAKVTKQRNGWADTVHAIAVKGLGLSDRVLAMREELATVTAERDRLREALKSASHALGMVGHGAPGNPRWMSHDPSIRQHCLNAEMAANVALSAPTEPKPEAAKCPDCDGRGFIKFMGGKTPCICNGTGRAQ